MKLALTLLFLTLTLFLVSIIFVKKNLQNAYPTIEMDLSQGVVPQASTQFISLNQLHRSLENDKAYGKTAYASGYYVTGIPSKATYGYHEGGWRSNSSTNTWYIVDLKEHQEISEISNTLYVDTVSPPTTIYISSNDLVHWKVLYTDVNKENSPLRNLKTIKINPSVKDRYVGFLAKNWNGGWADMTQFSVR
jgi:hypothetical protein